MTDLLASWTLGSHTEGGLTFPTYRKGTGPGVIVIHEIPGPTPKVVAFAEELVEAGHTVVQPHLFGRIGEPQTLVPTLRTLGNLCVRAEFTMIALNRTAPIATWLRSLARELHADVGGPGVGALGMCFTGGFALAMMVDPAVAAPVLAQPATPFPISRRHSRDLNLSPADLATVKERAAAGCAVLGLQYASDRMTGSRFETLTRELGDAFLRVDLPGKGHGTVTEHRSQDAVDAVLDFFRTRLADADEAPRPSAAPQP